MSEQGRADQESGGGVVDPNQPGQSSEVPADEVQQEQGENPQSPDEASEEPREGGGYDNPNSPPTPDDDADEEEPDNN